MQKIILFLIVGIAFILRFYRLGDYPALNADEAAIGYNAYSLLQTGRDEHGNPWPIHFQSFNDYKPGLYVYLVLPFVKLLGLNEWAVRTPNALLGVATVYLLYFLVIQLLKNYSLSTKHNLLATIASFFLAISPWHIHFSRGAWEVNTSTFLMVFGVYLFLVCLRSWNLLTFNLSLFTFILSLYTYHSARILTPLLMLGLLVIYFKDLKNHLSFKNFVLCSLFFVLLLLPLAKEIGGPAGLSRAAGVGLFADSGTLNRINEQRGQHQDIAGFWPRLLHNKPVNYTLSFLDNWASHFHGEFLFLSGDEIQRNKVPETGQMYMLDFLWIVFGVWWLVKNWKSPVTSHKPVVFIFYWLAVAPVAAALTFQSPHALRAQNMIIPLVIISAFGFWHIWNLLTSKGKYFLVIGHLSLVIFVMLQFIRYQRMYYFHMAKEYPFSSQYGVKELVDYLSENSRGSEKVIITNAYDQPYILFLFYLKYQPELFQKEHVLTGRDQYGFSTVRNFGKFEFTSFDFDSTRDYNPGALIVGTPKEIPDYGNIIKKIYGPNGYEYFRVVAN